MHGLNTTLGQTFFESVAHILSNGDKRGFDGSDFQIYADQDRVISEIMTDLKNGENSPNMTREDTLIAQKANGELVTGTNFTADCFIETTDTIVAIELKSVRPNSGETRGEKQKILKAKAALRHKYPDKEVKYIFGFPFDPTADSDTGSDKRRFMSSMIEFSKFCDENEILLADELWSFLSGETGTMQELLDLIRIIATPEFIDNFNYLNNIENIFIDRNKYIRIATEWCLYDEVAIASNADRIIGANNRKTTTMFYNRMFGDDGKYNDRRQQLLIRSI
jgi:hypothetical protein